MWKQQTQKEKLDELRKYVIKPWVCKCKKCIAINRKAKKAKPK